MSNNQQFVYYQNGQQLCYSMPSGAPQLLMNNGMIRPPSMIQQMVMPGAQNSMVVSPAMFINQFGVQQASDLYMRSSAAAQGQQFFVSQMQSIMPGQPFPSQPRLPGVAQAQHQQHAVPVQQAGFANASQKGFVPASQQNPIVYPNYQTASSGGPAGGSGPQYSQAGRQFAGPAGIQQPVAQGGRPSMAHTPATGHELPLGTAQNGPLPNTPQAQPQTTQTVATAYSQQSGTNVANHAPPSGSQISGPPQHGLPATPTVAPGNQTSAQQVSNSNSTRSIVVSVANVMEAPNNPPSNQIPPTASSSALAPASMVPIAGTAASATYGGAVGEAASVAGDVGGAHGSAKARYGNDRLFIPAQPNTGATPVPLAGQAPIVQVQDAHMEVRTIPAPQPLANMPAKRERRPLVIVNPDTKKVVDTDSIERERKERELRDKQLAPTPASENQPTTQSIVITDPNTKAVVHVARTPRTSMSESSSKHNLNSRNEVARDQSSSAQTITLVEEVAAAAPSSVAPAVEKVTTAAAKVDSDANVVAESPSIAAAVEKAVTPGTATEAPALEEPVTPAAADEPDLEEGELEKSLDVSVNEPASKATATELPSAGPGVKLVLVAEVIVERSVSGRWNYDRDTLLKLRPNGVAPKLAPEFFTLEQRTTPRSAGVFHGRQSFPGPRSADVLVPDFVIAPGMMPTAQFMKNAQNVPRGGSFQGVRGGGRKPMMVIEPLPSAAVSLHTVENAYVPNFIKSQQELAQESEPDKLRRKLLSILNKITPQKFKQLMIKTFDLINAVSTQEYLELVVSLIFEKAISEPNFSVAYSHVCRHLMDTNVPNPANTEKPITFKFILISKCQKEFEKKGDTPLQDQIKQRQDEINQEANEERRAQLRSEMDDITNKARRRALGNTKFIGELFKLEILTDTIVYFCLQHYLREGDDDSLECLCKLLITIGKNLESNQKFKDRFNAIFSRIKKIVDDKSCSLRLRCLLQDVLDLRENEWKPRREEGGPKTIDQIHADAQREETERAMYSQFAQFTAPRSNLPPSGEYREDLPTRGSNRRDRANRDDTAGTSGSFAIPSSVSSSKLQSAGGFADSESDIQIPYRRGSAKPSNTQSAIEPATTIKLPTTTVNALEVRLGPGAPRKAWGAGSQQAQPAATAATVPVATNTQNKEGRLPAKAQLPATKQGSGGAWRTSNASTDQIRGDLPPNRSAVASSTEKWSGQHTTFASRVANREQADTASAPTGSAECSDATPDRRGPVPAGSNAAPPSSRPVASSGRSLEIRIGSGPRIDETSLQQRASSVLGDYMDAGCRLVQESINELSELCVAENFDVFVRSVVNEAFEQRASERDDHISARRSCGQLLGEMFNQNVLNSIMFVKGLRAVSQDAPELELDLPRIYDYIAEVLAETIRGVKSHFILQCFAEILEPLRESKKSSTVFVSIFKHLERRLSKEDVERLWRSSTLDFTSFMDCSEVETTLKAHSLSYLTGAIEPPKLDLNDPLRFSQQLASTLEQLLRSNKSNDQVNEWIHSNVIGHVDKSEQIYAHFVRALTTAVTSAAVLGSKLDPSTVTIDLDKLKTRYSLLERYIDHKVERELHALCALQLFDEQLDHPRNVLPELFYELYNDEVISVEAFRDWRDAKEPHEATAFGVAKTALRTFYEDFDKAVQEDD